MPQRYRRSLCDVDQIDWSALEDAYGAAVELPRRLRSLAAGDADWEACLEDLYAGIYHQGSYYSATAVAAGFLVEIVADPSVPHRHRIVAFLADLSGGHHGDTITGWDAFTFRSSPAPPDYPEALNTVDAIAEGIPIFQQLLSDADPKVRGGAAYLLAGIARATEASHRAVINALHTESDSGARASMWLAAARLGQRSLPAAEPEAPPLVHAAIAVGNAWQGAVDEAALIAAATLEPAEHYAWSAISSLAVAALGGLEDKTPLAHVMRVWLDRGGPLYSFHDDRNEWSDTPGPSADSWHRDELLRATMTALAPHAFAAFVEREEPIGVDELTDEQREILTWTVDYGIAVPITAIPWVDRSAMARFLEGNGPLDTIVGGRPLWRWLYAIGDKRVSDDEIDALIGNLSQLEPEAIFDIATDIIAESYPHPNRFQPMLRDVEERILKLVKTHRHRLAERYTTYAERAIHEQKHNAKLGAARFAVPALRELGRLREVHDPLVGLALPRDPAVACTHVAAIPEPRRSIMVGRMTSSNRRDYLELCDLHIVAQHTVSTFLNDNCHTSWLQMDELLKHTGTDGIDALREGLTHATGRKRRLLERALADITGEVIHVTMHIAPHPDGLHITLHQDNILLTERVVPAHPSEADCAPLGQALSQPHLVQLQLSLHETLHDQRFRLMDLATSLGVRQVSLANGPSQQRL